MTEGIPTKYKGVQYRSRLEARWAAFFTHMYWSFRYEPFYLPGYLPDFIIKGPKRDSCLIEVKPAVTQGDYYEAVPKVQTALRRGNCKYDLIIVGVTPMPKSIWTQADPDDEDDLIGYPVADAFGIIGLRQFGWDFEPTTYEHYLMKHAWSDAKREIC
jgi:hypothetical protein